MLSFLTVGLKVNIVLYHKELEVVLVREVNTQDIPSVSHSGSFKTHIRVKVTEEMSCPVHYKLVRHHKHVVQRTLHTAVHTHLPAVCSVST